MIGSQYMTELHSVHCEAKKSNACRGTNKHHGVPEKKHENRMKRLVACTRYVWDKKWDLMIAVAPFLVTSILCYQHLLGGFGNQIYVGPHGRDWFPGRCRELPLRSIQAALDMAQPGDEICVLPGVYYERLYVRRSGSISKPIILRAAVPGKVTISGQLPEAIPSTWKWQNEGGGVYSTSVSTPVYRLRDGDVECFRVPWGGLAGLKSLVSKPNAWSAFCQEGDRLYLFLKDGIEPRQASLRTHRPAPPPREWGGFRSACIWIEADHIRLNGLSVDFGIGSAVHIWKGSDVEVRDCLFSGATYGVVCRGRSHVDGVSIVNCLYHNYPQYYWLRDWLTWEAVYASYSSSSLAASDATPILIKNCLVAHGGDALRISPSAEQSVGLAQIEGNTLAFCTDDIVEFDGDGAGVIFKNNFIYEAHQNLGFSPVETGPIHVRHNIFLHEPNGVNGSQMKLINNRVGERIQNILVDENIFVGNWLCWWSNNAQMDQIQVEANRFLVQRITDPPWPTSGVSAKMNQVQVVDSYTSAEHALVQLLDMSVVPQWVVDSLSSTAGPTWLRANEHAATRDIVAYRHRLLHQVNEANE